MTPSRISKIYDHFLEQLKLALPCHQELMDAEELDENPDDMLSKGYALAIGDGRNTDRCMESTAYYYERQFTVLLVRDVIAQQADKDLRKEKWKNALEDLHQVLKRLTGAHSIVDGSNVISFKVAYADDSGPRSTFIRDIPYVFIELTVTAEYREPTTGG